MIKIVGFEDGTFAVRKGNWLTGYIYLDTMADSTYWWHGARYHECFKVGTELAAHKLLASKDFTKDDNRDVGTPIKDKSNGGHKG